MFENPRRGRQARNFTTIVSKILDLKSSSEQIFFRKLSLGAPEKRTTEWLQTLLFRSYDDSFGQAIQKRNDIQAGLSKMTIQFLEESFGW